MACEEGSICMSTYLGMQPNSYCTQCGAPMYLIFDRMCPSCNCSGPAMSAYSAEATAGTEPQVTYEGQCPHCGGSMSRNARGSLHSCGRSEERRVGKECRSRWS